MIYLPFEVLTLRGFVPVECLNFTKDQVATYDRFSSTYEYSSLRSLSFAHTLSSIIHFGKIPVTAGHGVFDGTLWKPAGQATEMETVRCFPAQRKGWSIQGISDMDSWLKLFAHLLACKTETKGVHNVVYTNGKIRHLQIINVL